MNKVIFVVDDNDTNLIRAKEALEKHYRVMTMQSAQRMFQILEKVMPDLILLDIVMPDMNGFEALERIKSIPAYASIPIIFLTGYPDSVNEVKGFELGAIDFIAKPFSELVLLNRIRTHLDIDGLIRERTSMFEVRSAQLERLQNGIVLVLADLVENRDSTTGGHTNRTTIYIKLLMESMRANGVYKEEMKDWNIDLLASSAKLHDVGKIIVSDSILNKPGPLTKEEYATMKKHAREGERIIDQIAAHTGDVEFLHHAKLFAGYHHEYWNGGGYPHGLSGTDIPLEGRIMAIVDVYDALVSERPYKKPFSDEDAVHIIMADSGKQFDPAIANAFYDIREQFRQVSNRTGDVLFDMYQI